MPIKPPQDDPSPPGQRITEGLAKLALVMRHENWRASGQRGLTPTQTQALLAVVASTEPIGVSGVAERLALTRGSASVAVASLVEKGLIEKRECVKDGRASTLHATRRGRAEAKAAGQCSSGLKAAASAMPTSDQAGLLRGLIALIHELHERGDIPTSRMCVECVHFRPRAHGRADKPHHCAYIDAPIGDADLRIDCPDMQRASVQEQNRLWQVFVGGEPL